MRFRRAYIVTFLSLGFLLYAGNEHSSGSRKPSNSETCAECGVGNSEGSTTRWLSMMNAAIGEKLLENKRVPEPEPEPSEYSSVENGDEQFETASESDDEESDELPVSKYDMKSPMLEKVQASVREQAKLCRRVGRRTVCGEERGKGWCYRAVKYALVNAGVISGNWWPESPARLAHQNGTLKRKGFRDIKQEGFTSENAPIGSVLVYSGGPKGRGHIEVRATKYSYCSDYCAANPLDTLTKSGRAPRKLIGIYVKE